MMLAKLTLRVIRISREKRIMKVPTRRGFNFTYVKFIQEFAKRKHFYYNKLILIYDKKMRRGVLKGYLKEKYHKMSIYKVTEI